MAQKYLKPQKKFVSRTLIKKELNLSDKEFDELVTLIGLFPYVPKEKQKMDKIQDFFYRMTDYEKIKQSEVFKTFKINKKKLNKKKKYTEQGLLLRAEKIREEEYNYIDLIQNRYASFGKAVDELSSSLSGLSLSFKLNLDKEIEGVLNEFKNFVITNNLLKYGFMSSKGIYYEVNIKNIRIVWLNPYNGVNLEELIETKKDEPVPFKWSELNFLHYASEEEETDDSEEEYIKSDKLDVSLLTYAIPLQKYHIRLVLHNLKSKYKSLTDNLSRLFEDTKFFIDCDNLKQDLVFIVECCGGSIVEDQSFDICLGELFDNVIDGKLYCHPQYIFDSLNANKKLNINDYLAGKKLPEHTSPFKINNFIDPDLLTSLSKNKRNKLQNIIDGFDDVHYKGRIY
ncbi:hypothetical protein P3W45_000083 [Vairimorpha bombi]|jgi:hypothetical protein